MRWTPGGTSRNIEDRRASGGGGGFPVGPGMGLGGLVILVLSLLFGGNVFDGGDGGPEPTPPGQTTTQSGDVAVDETPAEKELVQFVSFVLDDAQRVWVEKAPALGTNYREAKLVLFRNVVRSGCGVAQSAMGPFYCPLDEKVYIDLGFYDELRRRFGAPGDFAQAYVLAHEIGHHLQKVTGTAGRVREMQERRPDLQNELSVRLELQADCYAGVWGRSTEQRQLLEQGDVEEGLGAAAAVGDDRIQEMSTGSIRPESFTHGSSEQRKRWFMRGFESGDPRSCDTFVGGV
jgi:uncharacterized protein